MRLIADTYWLGLPFSFRGTLPSEALAEPVQLKSADMRDSSGIYYAPKANPKPKIGLLAIHPRVDFSRHYIVPHCVEAGFSCLGLNSRCLNNDSTAVHEELILDVNAGVQFLRDKGAETVVLFGNSGGGSLSALFQVQARLPKGERLAFTPAGDPTMLNDVELFPADAFVAASAHRGQGLVLNRCIDPSVTDESDPTLVNRELDMYDTCNGFKEPPEQSCYSDEFAAAFRAAQLERVQRLDDTARTIIEDSRGCAKRYAEEKNSLDFMQWHHLGRRAALQMLMVVYRTMANLDYTDHHRDPSGRSYGSLISDRPDLMNMQLLGFGRVVTPQAWLSTWSGISSHANLVSNISKLDIPVLVCNATKDKEIYPADTKEIWNAVTAKDRSQHDFNASHYFEPPFGEKEAPDVKRLMDTVVPWIKERFE